MRNTEREAKDLAERFEGLNRAAFARDNKVPGGAAMIYQNITGRKPISLEGAIAYAKGFGCTVSDISRHWAEILATLPLYAAEQSNAYGSKVTPLESRVAALPPLQAELLAIAETMSETGVAILLGRAQEIALQHPAKAVKNQRN